MFLFFGGFWEVVFFGVCFFSEKMARVVWYALLGSKKIKEGSQWLAGMPHSRWVIPLTVTTMAANVRNVEVQRKKKKREGGVIKGDWKVDIHPRYTTFMGCPEISMVMSRFSSPQKKGLLCWVEGCFSPKYQTWWCFSCRERSTKTTSQEIGVGNEHQNHDDDDDDDDGCGGCMYCTLKLQSILMVQAPRILHGTMILWGHASHAPLDIFWEQGQYKIENTLGMQHPWDAALKTACRNCCRFSSKKKDYVY